MHSLLELNPGCAVECVTCSCELVFVVITMMETVRATIFPRLSMDLMDLDLHPKCHPW